MPWSDFLIQGNLKYIGYAYIVLAAAIIVLSFTRKKDYDEYQVGILEKGFLIAGIVMGCLFPLSLLLVLSDPNYSIETLIFLVIAHWSVVLIADLIYVIKWGKSKMKKAKRYSLWVFATSLFYADTRQNCCKTARWC